MKPQVRVNFAFFWPGFQPEQFRAFFPFLYAKYDVVLSPEPDIVFYSVFAPGVKPYPDPRAPSAMPRLKKGRYVRVFLTGENFEPDMDYCDFAITFSALVAHPNHLRLPLWVYEGRGFGFGPERLVKAEGVDWERIAAEKSGFCNFVYRHDVPFRNAVFAALNAYKRVDAAGSALNNMAGWTLPLAPNRAAAKIEFFRRHKFTLAVENTIWPGYTTEKLVDPMFADSIPIYVGDPLAHLSFDRAGYIDLYRFSSLKEMLEFVREADNNHELYLKMLAAPHYCGNVVPAYARDETALAFFDRIVAAALGR